MNKSNRRETDMAENDPQAPIDDDAVAELHANRVRIFEIFRFPKPELDPEMAREWLRDKYIYLNAAMLCGYYSDDEDVRSAFAFIANDLESVVNACIKVLQTGNSVKVETTSLEDADSQDFTATLARVVLQRDLIDDRGGEQTAEYGFDELTSMYIERVQHGPKLNGPLEEAILKWCKKSDKKATAAVLNLLWAHEGTDPDETDDDEDLEASVSGQEDAPEASEVDDAYAFSVTDVLDASQLETVDEKRGKFRPIELTLIPAPELHTHADLPVALSNLLPWLDAACDLADARYKGTYRLLSEIEDILQAIDQGFRLNQVPRFKSDPEEDTTWLIQAALTIQDRDDCAPSIRFLMKAACPMVAPDADDAADDAADDGMAELIAAIKQSKMPDKWPKLLLGIFRAHEGPTDAAPDEGAA